MGISFGSINTGLPKDIVQQLVAAERIPIQNMEAQKSKVTDKKALVDKLVGLVEGVRGDLATVGSARSLRDLKITTNNEVIEVAADKNVAIPGTYQFQVDDVAQKSSAMSSGFADKDNSYVGVGYIQYSLPNGDSREIYIDSDHSSLSGISKLINSDPKLNLQANVVNDGSGSDTPWRLVCSLKETGAGQKAEFPYFYLVDGEQDFYLEFEREAHNAKVKLDGFEVELGDNKTKDLIPGLAINLKKAKPGEEFTIKVEEDTESITKKITGLIEKVNAVIKFINEQNTLDEKTDTSRTLGGDIILQTIESKLRNAIYTQINTSNGPHRASEIGISFQKDGTIMMDEKKMNTKLKEDYKQAAEILSGFINNETGLKSNGLIDNINEATQGILRMPDGILASRKKSMAGNIEQINSRISDVQRRVAQKEENLKLKFARLEESMAKMKSQGASLAGMNPVTQLG